MRKGRLTTLAIAATFLAIGAGAPPAGSGGNPPGPWERGEAEESAATEVSSNDSSEEHRATSVLESGTWDSEADGWNDDESDADEWADSGREDEGWTDENSEPAEGESEKRVNQRSASSHL